MIACKFLLPGRIAPFSRLVWPKDDWVVEAGPVDSCRRGIHACRLADLAYWIAPELWLVELAGEIVEGDLKVVATRGRLVGPVEGWDDRTQREFSESCARRTGLNAGAELRAEGLNDAARSLETAVDLVALISAAAAASEAAYEAGKPDVARVAEYAGDAAEAVGEVPPAMVAYIAAHAADACSSAGVDDPFAAERAVQSQWLAERLGLGDSVPELV